MSRNIYALLVGIDNYSVKPLRGCINDVLAVQEYLTTRVNQKTSENPEGWDLHLKVLTNEQATRQGIIDGFRTHLRQANQEDVALFYYSGHGARQKAPPEFWQFPEKEEHNETLVCYDSRSPGGWDLADKELAQLIAEVAEKNPHITLILDCCHSGTGTRDMEEEIGVREFPVDMRSRPAESFLISPQAVANLTNQAGVINIKASGWNLPRSKHILLASCQNSETAKEYTIEGNVRGAFCYFLTETLKQTQGNITYRDLFKRVNALVRSKKFPSPQSPQLEAIDSQELDQLFLGGVLQKSQPYYTVSHHHQHGWIIDGGAVHGLPYPQGEETTHLALFPINSLDENLCFLANKIATARVTGVLPQLSKIEINEVVNTTELDSKDIFKAVIVSLPLPPKYVSFVGDGEGVKLLQKALQTNSSSSQSSPYLREVNGSEIVNINTKTNTKAIAPSTDFKVIAKNGEYLITRPADSSPIVNHISGYTSASANQVIERLEHITRWMNLCNLTSPINSRISPDAIQLEIYQDNKIVNATDICFHYYQDDNGKWQPAKFKIKLTNTSDETLYCALLDLTETFAITAPFFEAGHIKLEPQESAWASGGKAMSAVVPDQVWKQGITKYQDILKLIVCANEFDARLLEQGKLDVPHQQYTQRSVRSSTLNRLMNRWQSRDFVATESADEYDDWFATQVVITTNRPLEKTTIPNSGRNISLGVGVELKPHPYLKAQVRLSTVISSTRNLENNYLPPIFRENPHLNPPFPLTNTRDVETSTNAIALTAVNSDTLTTVTRENPLILVVDTPLAPGEKVLPIAYDGEFYLPLGVGYSCNGKTEIRLEQLPIPEKSGERSLQSAFKIYFQKVASDILGSEYTYPQLAVAKVSSDEEVSYETDLATVKQQVAQAQKIVLFIHGIIGTTKRSVQAMQKSKCLLAGQDKPLADMYDLILTFDYENLNTSIEENARSLKQKLAEIGLGANHGKELHIVAHSMGGLISRWFIEREQGNQVVKHLVMFGTPNAGSTLSTIQDWATTLLTFGLNSVSGVALPVQILGNLLASLETIDISLDQMRPGSDVLKSLAASSDPGIPYTIVAGNNSALLAIAQMSKLQRLAQKTKKQTFDLVFLGQANDIAATVKSITSVDSQRNPQPQIQEVNSNHLSYFYDQDGLNALRSALMDNVAIANQFAFSQK